MSKLCRFFVGLTLALSCLLVSSGLVCSAQHRAAGAAAALPKKWSGAKDPQLVEISVNGVKRSYYLYIPKSARLPAPTVFVFHGGGGNAWSLDWNVGGMARLADEKGIVLINPDGVDKHWYDGRSIKGQTQQDDVAFIDAVIKNLVRDRVADSSRVYACGISNGGFFSQYLAQQLKGKIAAVASVAASVSEEMAASQATPVPIMFVLGDKDPLVPFNGGDVGGKLLRKSRGKVIPFEQAVDFYRKVNRSSALTFKQKLPDSFAADRCRTEVMRFGEEGASCEVLVYRIYGGGHTWPQGLQYLPATMVGPVCRDFNCNEAILKFFLAHQKQESGKEH